MLDLTNTHIGFLILEDNDISRSILYSMDYTILYLNSYIFELNKHNSSRYILACKNDNESLRSDSLFILKTTESYNMFIKYVGEDSIKTIISNGSEFINELNHYNTDNSILTFVYEGYSFGLKPGKKYIDIVDKSQLSNGMVVELNNKGTWIKKVVENVDFEYESIYKTFIKYNKIRIVKEDIY